MVVIARPIPIPIVLAAGRVLLRRVVPVAVATRAQCQCENATHDHANEPTVALRHVHRVRRARSERGAGAAGLLAGCGANRLRRRVHCALAGIRIDASLSSAAERAVRFCAIIVRGDMRRLRFRRTSHMRQFASRRVRRMRSPRITTIHELSPSSRFVRMMYRVPVIDTKLKEAGCGELRVAACTEAA